MTQLFSFAAPCNRFFFTSAHIWSVELLHFLYFVTRMKKSHIKKSHPFFMRFWVDSCRVKACMTWLNHLFDPNRSGKPRRFYLSMDYGTRLNIPVKLSENNFVLVRTQVCNEHLINSDDIFKKLRMNRQLTYVWEVVLHWRIRWLIRYNCKFDDFS